MNYKTYYYDGYKIFTIKTDKFKNCYMEVTFREDARKVNVTKRNALVSLLTYTSEAYPTKREMLIKSEELYNVSFGGSISRSGYNLLSSCGIDFLKPKVVSEKNYLEDTISFLFECLTHPHVKEEKFNGEKYSVTEYTMSEIIASVYSKIRDSGLKEGILFIDEINCVSETLAPTMLQFLQCKTFGNRKVPEGWIIAAAGNPPEYNKSVHEFDMVTLDRVRKIEVDAEYSVWREYARENRINIAITSYLELRPQSFYKAEADVDGIQFVTARGWEDLSCLVKVYKELSIDVDEEIIYEFIQHRETAKDVAVYLDLYKKYQDDYGINSILAGNVPSSVYERIYRASFDERLSVVNLLKSGLDIYFDKTFGYHFIATEWYFFLRVFKERMEKMGDNESCLDVYNNIYKDYTESINPGIKAGFYTKEQEGYYIKFMEIITENRPSANNPYEAFNQADEGFEIWCTELENLEEQTGTALENAFDFMEAAFGNGQEMVVFVTELTMDRKAVSYLSENKCERYLKYNEELMAGTKKAQILSMLEKDEIYGKEHIKEF